MRALPLPLAALALALAGTAPAAPAPFRRPEPPQAPRPDVQLRGWLSHDRFQTGGPFVITRAADWRGLAKAWGIQGQSEVDFRTHFLAVHVVEEESGFAVFELSDRGDLRAVFQPRSLKCGLEVAGR